ncbi:MAG: methionyl-tRNA formyltransferase [Ilumatobacteraceae bacterium]
MTNTYVVASTRIWDSNRAQQLATAADENFVFIGNDSELTFDYLTELSPRYVFFPFWSHRIDRQIYESFECVIFHMTDLPFGRGGSPLQNLIIRGISGTKISAIKCVEELDAGPIYLKRELTLDGPAQEILDRAATIIESMILEIIQTNPQPIAQVGPATLFKRRKPAEGNLNSATSIGQMYDLIRMLDADGYPNAFLELDKFRFEFRNARLSDGKVQAEVSIFPADQQDGKLGK